MLDIRICRIKLGPYTFSPGLIPTVVTVLLLILLFSLGQWQLRRAEFKDNLKQAVEQRRDVKPVDLELLPQERELQLFRPVVLTGRFDTGKSFLLDNRVVNRTAGFDVITPFKTNNGQWLLIDRGWLPQVRAREVLPTFNTSADELTLTGFIRTPSENVYMLDEHRIDATQWPVIIQRVDVNELGKVLDSELYPQVVMLDEMSPAGFDRHWPALKFDSSKHVGYAIQWFALFSALLAIFILVNTKKKIVV